MKHLAANEMKNLQPIPKLELVFEKLPASDFNKWPQSLLDRCVAVINGM